jgi:hypothetical protein
MLFNNTCFGLFVLNHVYLLHEVMIQVRRETKII